MSDIQENSCAFYASDYHLEMIMLPYINENLKNDKKVYVFTENNLEETINTLISRVNLEESAKEKVLKINWKKDDENKYNNLLRDKEESLVFIKGNENYIKKVNNNLNQLKNYKKIKIVDCYDVNDISEDIENIANHYKKILNTTGK